MEESIKVLEELVQNIKRVNERTLDCEIEQWCKEKEAIETLIKGYRELEEDNSRLGMLNLVQEDMIKELEKLLNDTKKEDN